MTINRNLRSLLLGGGIAVMAGFALSGCDRDKPDATATAPTTAAATTAAAAAAATTSPVDPTAPGSSDDAAALADDGTGNEVADMERHHMQAMNHAQMRAGAARPDAAPPTDSPPAPMKDM